MEISTPPVEISAFNSTPLWRRDAPRLRHVRGILFEENGLKPKELEVSISLQVTLVYNEYSYFLNA